MGSSADISRLYDETDGVGLADLVKRGEISALELIDEAERRVHEVNPKINAVVINTFDFARANAIAEPGTGPLAGVPFLLKNIGSACKGIPLDFGMKALQGIDWKSETEMVSRIRSAGLSIIGRTNSPENGWSIGSENNLYGATRNPYDLSRTSGGSSGGAAASVAARIVPVAEASDGGGSIRVPASCCGVVGLKPSRGRITYGSQLPDVWFGSVYVLCNSLTVRDTAAFMDVTAGNSVGDPYTAPRPTESWLSSCMKSPVKLKIGFTKQANWGPKPDEAVISALDARLETLASIGHELIEYDLKTGIEDAWWNYNNVVAVEYLRDFMQLGLDLTGLQLNDDEFAPFNQALMRQARSLSAEQYSANIAAIRKAGQNIAIELSQFDVYMTPTLTNPPRPVGYWSMEEGDWDTYLNRWYDAAFMFIFNISGLPAISLPGQPTKDGLPIGIQFVGHYGDETTLLQLARQIEEAAPWSGRVPRLA